MTYQHVLLLSAEPRKDNAPYPDRNPLPDLVTDVPVPTIEEQAAGEAVIEVSLIGSSVNRDRCSDCIVSDVHG